MSRWKNTQLLINIGIKKKALNEIYSTPEEGRAAEGTMPKGWDVLDIMLREFISQCKDLVFCQPYWWGKIESEQLLRKGKCRHHLIPRDLIWKKDCCLKLFTNKECDYFSHSICSFYQLYFNWNNYSIKFINWSFSMIAKSSPKQPRTTWHHNT